MSIATDGLPIIELLSNYTRSGMIFCILVQFLTVPVSRLLNMPSLQRTSISVTCAFAGFSAASYSTDMQSVWLVIAAVTFYVTYAHMPRFAGEEEARRLKEDTAH